MSPLISRQLWEHVQELLDSRLGERRKKGKHDFAFSGIMTCPECGHSLIGEIKKGKYVYYRCGGGKECSNYRYVREAVFEEEFARILKSLCFDRKCWTGSATR